MPAPALAALLLSAAGAPPHPLEAGSPHKPDVLGPQDMDILRKLAVRFACVSKAVDLKSATCNRLCQEGSSICPKGCSCTRTRDTRIDLTKGIPSKEYKQLGLKWIQKHPSSELPTTNATDLARIKLSRKAITPVALPEEQLEGFYAKTWACRADKAACNDESKNLHVVFSGYADVNEALEAYNKKDGNCTEDDMKWCDAQADFLVTTGQAKTKDEAIQQVVAEGSATELTCKICLAPDPPEDPASTKGVKFLMLGGANMAGTMSAMKFDALSVGDTLEQVRAAGFQGVGFDIEMTIGEGDLVDAQERAFAACKEAGLLVMITTSHTAPYAAGSDTSKMALVDSWAKDENIDIFSPQLYSSGDEDQPEFDITPCPGDACTYERIASMKAKWVPSLPVQAQATYPEVKEFFREKGVETAGYIVW